ncbi:MAG: SprT family zinc-dependent metalloprotease [Pseudomonadota bacterium]
MTTRLPLPGSPDIWVELVRHPRAKRLTLRVSQLDGAVRLTLPKRASQAAAAAFLAEKAHWVRTQLAQFKPPLPVSLGAKLPIDGVLREVVEHEGNSPTRLGPDTLSLPRRRGALGPRIGAWVKLRARDHLTACCQRHATAIDRRFTQLRLRDTRSRWGSCTSQGSLMFNWRLVLAPPPVLDYVAAHEVAHLQEMNHSPAFWAIVARLSPQYETHQNWLRAHGTSLHRYGFD